MSERERVLTISLPVINEMDGIYYFYRAIGPQQSFVVQEVAESEMHGLHGLENITLYRYGGEEIAVLFQAKKSRKSRILAD